MKLTLDVENTTTERNGKLYLDPFEPENSLTMVGMLTDQDDEKIVVFDHEEASPPDQESFDLVQSHLDKTTVLICHNAAYDLMWLWESRCNTYSASIVSNTGPSYLKPDSHSRIRS